MSEEIKEIIKDNDELLVTYKDNSFRTFDTLTVDVIDYIINLEQENRQLKEKIILLQASEPMLELTKYYGERYKYKSVLDEIREYVKKCSFSIEDITSEYHDIVYAEDIEEILDKVNIDPNDVSKMFKNCTILEPFLEHMDKVKE